MNPTYDELQALIRHMALHGNYCHNGYWQMTKRQKEIYRHVTGTTHESAEHTLKLIKERVALN